MGPADLEFGEATMRFVGAGGRRRLKTSLMIIAFEFEEWCPGRTRTKTAVRKPDFETGYADGLRR